VRRYIYSVLALVLLTNVGPRPGYAALPPPNHLDQALAALAAENGSIEFTDWSLLKQYEGVSSLTSAGPEAPRMRFFASLDQDQTAFSAYDIAYAATHAKNWSWDSTDLVWEAAAVGVAAPPTQVLRFRSDFNFAPVVAHFRQRGFTQGSYHGVPVYSHPMGLAADWALTTGFSTYNTAVLASRHLLVLSLSLSAVHATLDVLRGARPSFAGDPAIDAAATGLGTTASSVIFTGTQACRIFSPRLVLGPAATSAAIAALRHKYAVDNVHRYDALAIGYRDQGARPLGYMVLRYANRAVALADLPIRRSIAQSGISPLIDEPYSHLFTLEQAVVAGNAVVLTMQPVSGRPQVFVDMVATGDLAFAWRPCG